MSKISINLLNEEEKAVLFGLKPFFNNVGFLSGGTALMLQIPFRKSYDFDIFFPYEIPKNFLRKASDIFKSGFEVLINTNDELTFIANKKIKVSFIFFPFKRNYAPCILENNIQISSFKDIASDKAYTIGRRPEYRDYVDLFIILKNNFSLNQVIMDAKEKFKGEFSEKLFLAQLVFFEDLKDFNVEFINKKHNPDEIKDFLKKTVTDYQQIF